MRLKAATLARSPTHAQRFVQRGGMKGRLHDRKGGSIAGDGFDPSRLVVGPMLFPCTTAICASVATKILIFRITGACPWHLVAPGRG